MSSRDADDFLAIDYPPRAGHGQSADTSRLTPLEFKLLSVFVHTRTRCSRASQLLELVWGDVFGVSRRPVKLYVGYLRRKLSPAAPETTHWSRPSRVRLPLPPRR